MKENIEEDIEIVKAFLEECDRVLVGEICLKCNGLTRNAIEAVFLEYKRVLKENEELKKKYNSLTDKIILKIDEYDYKFEKAKKQSKNDIADYYWDLIINFKKLLGGK